MYVQGKDQEDIEGNKGKVDVLAPLRPVLQFRSQMMDCLDLSWMGVIDLSIKGRLTRGSLGSVDGLG